MAGVRLIAGYDDFNDANGLGDVPTPLSTDSDHQVCALSCNGTDVLSEPCDQTCSVSLLPRPSEVDNIHQSASVNGFVHDSGIAPPPQQQ